MLSNRYILLLYFFFHLTVVNAQTVGVTINTDASLDGFTFFSPFSSTKAYLVDNCGRLINEWDRGTRPGLAAYFLDNGLMFRTYKPSPKGPFTSASNAGGLELVDWENNTVWSYEINTAEWISHHDATMMPNGNILALTWQLVYRDELVSLGRNPNEIAPENFMWSEKIIELEPTGQNQANIVWEWNIYDHYIQDFDDSKLGFGIVADHPELFDINLPDINSSNSNSSRDWNHFNAIDYHPGLDQILISVRNSDEVWIIDHSTTTAEAAEHTGGNYGKGGDILYRWGNASAYKRGSVSDQKLFGQHGVNWIDDGLNDSGKILIYNNGNGRPGTDFSTVEIVEPPQADPGHYIITQKGPFGPEEANWVYGDLPGEQFFSPYLSNAQRLPNGNTLVNTGSIGIITEIHPNRSKVWEYIIPLIGNVPVEQGQNVFNNGNFRAYKFASNFHGFDNIDLSPGDPIELNPLECTVTTGIKDFENGTIKLYFDAVNQAVRVFKDKSVDMRLNLFDLSGRHISSAYLKGQDEVWYISELPLGVYFVRVEVDRKKVVMSKIILY